MAGMPSCAQTSASSSGTLAPSRKLKADATWKSMNMLVINRIKAPCAGYIAINQKESLPCAGFYCYVPFVADPSVFPPLAGDAPRSGTPDDFAFDRQRSGCIADGKGASITNFDAQIH